MRVMKFDISSETPVDQIRPIGAPGAATDGEGWVAVTGDGTRRCLYRPRPTRMEVVSARKLDVDLSTVGPYLIGPDGEEVKLVVDLRPSGHEPKVILPVGFGPDGLPARAAIKVRLTSTGVDINGDGDEDVTILAKSVKQMTVHVRGANSKAAPRGGRDDIRVVARDTGVAYRGLQVNASPGGSDIELDMPRTHVAVVGNSGDDRIVVRGVRNNASGEGGDDVIDARGGYGPITMSGGAGNDRIYFGRFGGSAGKGGFSGSAETGNDIYIGGTGPDEVWDLAGRNTLQLRAGNDIAVVRGGPKHRDIVRLDAGNDELVVYPHGRVAARLGAGNDKVLLFGDAWKFNFIDCGLGRDWLRAPNRSRSRNCEQQSR